MKNNTAKPNKENQSAFNTKKDNADIKWFEQFDDNPGIYDVYSKTELKVLKSSMLNTIKRRINEQD